MRRRRQKLEVSTFPFLAVLLCAMGSLILLMLVIDRRARVVARAKTLKAADAARAQDSSLQTEWEQRRRRLHEQLAGENDSVAIQTNDLRNRILQTTHVAEAASRKARSLD